MIDPASTLIAIVPARGGSKSIPLKNLVDLNGLPLLGWTLKAVAAAKAPIRLIVSTDSGPIADAAEKFGAEVIFRPSDLAADETPTEPVISHALGAIEAHQDDTILLLQATSPLRGSRALDDAIAQYFRDGRDCLVAVVCESPFLWREGAGSAQPLYDPSARRRRQDLGRHEITYRETGSIYIFRKGGLDASQNRIHGRVSLFVMETWESIDIDDASDLQFAKLTLQAMAANGACP
jgi:CMP-N,N'-diacetyllegionaminic acid synthase